MQRRDSARAQKAEATRLALIEAARKLFTSRGYHEVGVRDFAAQAGVTRGALYHHFPDKEALFIAVFDAVEQELMSETSNHPRSSSDAWTRFREGIQVYLAAVYPARCTAHHIDRWTGGSWLAAVAKA